MMTAGTSRFVGDVPIWNAVTNREFLRKNLGKSAHDHQPAKVVLDPQPDAEFASAVALHGRQRPVGPAFVSFLIGRNFIPTV